MRLRALLLLLALSVAVMGDSLRWDSLRLVPGDDERHLKGLLKAVSEKTAGWSHYPLRQGGNFLTERWMRGDGDVLNSYFMGAAGSEWYQVEALHYQLPEAFGCLLSAGRNPVKDGVGACFWYCSGGKSIVGEGADLDFTIWQDGKLVSKLPVLRLPLELPEPFELEGPLLQSNWREDLGDLKDTRTFLSTASTRYDAGLTAFEEALAEGRVKKRVYGEYKGGGIPPESHLVPVNTVEASELRRHVETRVSSWKRVLAEYGQEMHRTLLEVVPLEALTS